MFFGFVDNKTAEYLQHFELIVQNYLYGSLCFVSVEVKIRPSFHCLKPKYKQRCKLNENTNFLTAFKQIQMSQGHCNPHKPPPSKLFLQKHQIWSFLLRLQAWLTARTAASAAVQRGKWWRIFNNRWSWLCKQHQTVTAECQSKPRTAVLSASQSHFSTCSLPRVCDPANGKWCIIEKRDGELMKRVAGWHFQSDVWSRMTFTEKKPQRQCLIWEQRERNVKCGADSQSRSSGSITVEHRWRMALRVTETFL